MSKAPKTVLDLVELFGRNIETYRSSAYKETMLRQEFINPFFEALGWDIYNKAGYAEVFKEVIHEDAIKVEGSNAGFAQAAGESKDTYDMTNLQHQIDATDQQIDHLVYELYGLTEKEIEIIERDK